MEQEQTERTSHSISTSAKNSYGSQATDDLLKKANGELFYLKAGKRARLVVYLSYLVVPFT